MPVSERLGSAVMIESGGRTATVSAARRPALSRLLDPGEAPVAIEPK
jgi:hypothetical protein